MLHGEPQQWRDVRLGLIVLAGLAPVTAAVFFLDAARREVREGPTLIVIAEEVHGLAVGADVWVAGRPSGRVADISFVGAEGDAPGMVALDLALHHGAAAAVRRDADARVGRSSLLASPVVKLDPGSHEAPPYDFRDTLIAKPTPTLDMFKTLADTGKVAAAKLTSALGELDALMRTGRGTLPRLRRDETLAAGLGARRSRAASLRTTWGRESGLRGLVRDTAVRSAAARVGVHLDAISEGWARVSDTQATTSLTMDSLSARAERIGRRLADGEGTLGRMATDGELRLQTSRTRGALDSLMIDAKVNPLRYLRLRLF